jgi:hypothetical protein
MSGCWMAAPSVSTPFGDHVALFVIGSADPNGTPTWTQWTEGQVRNIPTFLRVASRGFSVGPMLTYLNIPELGL